MQLPSKTTRPEKGKTENKAVKEPANNVAATSKSLPTKEEKNNVRKLDEATSTQTSQKSDKTDTFVTKFAKQFVPRDPAGRLEGTHSKPKKQSRMKTHVKGLTKGPVNINATMQLPSKTARPEKGKTENGAVKEPANNAAATLKGLPTKEEKVANAKAKNSPANASAAAKTPAEKNNKV